MISESLCWIRDKMWEEFAELFASYGHFVVLVVLIDQVEEWLNLHCSWLYRIIS